MPARIDGPASPCFRPLPFAGTVAPEALGGLGVSEELVAAAAHAPRGACVGWGIPFALDRVLLVRDGVVTVPLDHVNARWLVFQHTADLAPFERNAHGFPLRKDGPTRLGEQMADYVICYADGSEVRVPILRRHQVTVFQFPWGENCFEAVNSLKPCPVPLPNEQQTRIGWGFAQVRSNWPDGAPWVSWLYAWENPHPDIAITGIRFEPINGALVVAGISAGDVETIPLRWRTRRKALLTLPADQAFDATLDEHGNYAQIRLDLGQVISAMPRPRYPREAWAESYNNCVPELAANEVIVEYTAHPDACFHLAGAIVPVREVEARTSAGPLAEVAPATQRVRLRVVERGSTTPVAVKLHVHGEAGEYLPPVDRHRRPNPSWYEDYSVDFTHLNRHPCCYIPGETTLNLPLGTVYIEVSKGFEIRPVRLTAAVTPETAEIVIELDRVLHWREQGWVTADTHVHFLSPGSALLEGAGEGVNVVNLLASQWGELMTNVGDFDGRTTFGSREAGGDGEYLVRVGTENRQHLLGHISLLGYNGGIIAPMTCDGPHEAALGDPLEALLTEWARQCKAQDGVVVIPHFPMPRAEHAAALVSGDADAVEMTSWGDLYSGIDPYSLVDWYRYLNCGYRIAAVGGTDKMATTTAVGTVRTYAHLRDGEFTYDAWKDAVRRAETFVTYGPLLEFAVEGQPAGSRIPLPAGGGTVDVTWQACSVTVPMSRVELIVNGEVRESLAVAPDAAAGHFTVPVHGSSWIALLVRGHYPDQPEIIAAHTSPIMLQVEGTPFFAAADALTILQQIEGALAYLDTIGTRADTAAYQRMRLVLTGVHRTLHNRLHESGHYHHHTPVTDHPEHH